MQSGPHSGTPDHHMLCTRMTCRQYCQMYVHRSKVPANRNTGFIYRFEGIIIFVLQAVNGSIDSSGRGTIGCLASLYLLGFCDFDLGRSSSSFLLANRACVHHVSLPSTLEAAALFHVLGFLLFCGDFAEGIYIHGHAIAARRWARRQFEATLPPEGPGAIRRGKASLLAKDVVHNSLIKVLSNCSSLQGVGHFPSIWREDWGGAPSRSNRGWTGSLSRSLLLLQVL
jgi:hypothetical protein